MQDEEIFIIEMTKCRNLSIRKSFNKKRITTCINSKEYYMSIMKTSMNC